MLKVDTALVWVRRLSPDCFALVMATGIVSVAADQHGMHAVAQGMFWLNLVIYVWLLALSALRLACFRSEMTADFIDPSRGAGFLTVAAATCILGTQCMTVMRLPHGAIALAVAGAVLWLALIYLFFAGTITARIKPGFTRSINGGWLVAVVATQSLAALLALLSRGNTAWLFSSLCLYLLGAALYLLIITLVVYRMVFFPLRAYEFTPPYWIDMGALAVTTLAGSLVVQQSPATGPLADLLPFVKGFTLFFWATASWWIPLLVILEIWRHGWRHVPLRYETDDWDIVFPIGMYTVGTYALAQALHTPFLLIIPAVGVYVSLLAWLLIAVIGLQRLYRKSVRAGSGHR